MLCIRGTSNGPVSVCVCLSKAGVLLKRQNVGSHKQTTRYPRDSSFLTPKISAKFDRGHPLLGRQMQVGWVKIGDSRQITGLLLLLLCLNLSQAQVVQPVLLSSVRYLLTISILYHNQPRPKNRQMENWLVHPRATFSALGLWYFNVTLGDVTWRSLNANVRYILRCICLRLVFFASYSKVLLNTV